MSGQVAFTLVADDAKARAQIDKFLRDFEGQAQRTEQKAGGIAGAFDKAGKASQNFVTSSIAGMASLGGAVGLVIAALKEQEALQERAKQSLLATEDTRRQFLQLGGGADVIRNRINTGQEIARIRGIDENVANRFLFSMISAGQEDQAKELSEVFNLGAGSENIATGAATITSAFGKQESGTMRGIVNKLLVAAKDSQVTAGAFAPAITEVAPIASQIGTSDEETMAIVAQLTNVTGDAGKAATQAKGLAVAIQRLQEKGELDANQGILGNLAQIQELGLGNVVGLGSQEAASGFASIMKMQPQIGASIASIRAAEAATGGAGDFLSTTLAEGAKADSTLAKTLEQRQSDIELDQTKRGPRGTREADQDIATNRLKQQFINEGTSPVAYYVGVGAAGVADWLDLGPRAVGAAGRAGARVVDTTGAAALARSINALINALDRNTDGGVSVPGGEAANRP